MLRAFWENFGENFRRERPEIVHSRSRKTRMKPSKTGKPLPKSQLDFESFSLRPLRYISLCTSCSKAAGQELPEPLDSPIIITKFPLSVNWFSAASAGYIFKGCAASCEKAAVSLRLHLTDAMISGNVSKLGKSLTIWPGSFSRRERFWNEWSRRGRQKRESNL